MIKSTGNFIEERNEFEFTSFRSEEFQFVCNNLVLELKDHNYSSIRPGFVSRTLVDRDFQHNINSLHFLVEGSAVLTFGNKKQTLSAGDIFMIGNHVKCSWEYTKPSVEITLLFDLYLGNLDDLFTSLKNPLIIKNCFDDVKKMQTLFEKDTYITAFQMKQLCLDYLIQFLDISGIDLTRHIGLIKKYEKVFRYIRENLSMSLHLDQIASATNYSTGFFTKSFARDNGVTVKQYIHDKLMSEAEQLLIYSDLSLTGISDSLGFCELSYFTRWFKKNKGCTPTAYRKRLKQMR